MKIMFIHSFTFLKFEWVSVSQPPLCSLSGEHCSTLDEETQLLKRSKKVGLVYKPVACDTTNNGSRIISPVPNRGFTNLKKVV